MNGRLFLISGLLSILLLFSIEVLSQDSLAKPKPKLIKEVSGNFRGDYRYFPDKALYPDQQEQYFSMVFQPEIYLEWNKGKQILKYTGFARIDQYDNRSTHADVRELYFQFVLKKWELSFGAKNLYWGVTESNHLVDIINQGDALEGFGLNAKLGQPMIHFSWSPKWGTIDLIAMTYFREMRFPGKHGRLRPPFDIDYSNTTYESDMEEYNPDLAIRWSHALGPFDLGLSHFYGTSRLPIFTTSDGQTFSPHYELINQTGFDVQAATGPMLWKGEIIRRESKRKLILALVVGGEFTFSNVLRKGIDIGIIAEYNYDDRGLESINALDDDFFFGMRFAFNDRQSTDMIGGLIVDRNNGTLRYFAKASRRIGNSWKFSLEASRLDNINDQEFLYLIRNDSFVQISLAKFF
ncbi:MAG: hypothetical protein COB85_03215 [Bacteroidetes bacterium]|nr:MAG: hypothetical protein COB85_03215 [Bacteroidota bacterium]